MTMSLFKGKALLLFEAPPVYTRHVLRLLLDGVGHRCQGLGRADFHCACGYLGNAICTLPAKQLFPHGIVHL
jgi:hypothetical protein